MRLQRRLDIVLTHKKEGLFSIVEQNFKGVSVDD
jgi:hypothetical protein